MGIFPAGLILFPGMYSRVVLQGAAWRSLGGGTILGSAGKYFRTLWLRRRDLPLWLDGGTISHNLWLFVKPYQ